MTTSSDIDKASDINKAYLKYREGQNYHYNMHNRTSSIESCSIKECKKAVKVWLKANGI